MTLRDSTTGGFVSDGWERGWTALSSSVVIGFFLDALRMGWRSLSSSTTGQWLGGFGHKMSTTVRNSRTTDAVRWGERAVHTSWLYRWLTAEPEVDVVVIDLRETMFVGPVLAVLDRVFGLVARNWDRSVAGTAATRLSDQFTAHPIRAGSIGVLVAVLAALLLLVGLGSLSRSTVGIALLVASLALAGTRVTVSTDELTETGAYVLAVALLTPPNAPENLDDRPEK